MVGEGGQFGYPPAGALTDAGGAGPVAWSIRAIDPVETEQEADRALDR
jgi:hypothetical protein